MTKDTNVNLLQIPMSDLLKQNGCLVFNSFVSRAKKVSVLNSYADVDAKCVTASGIPFTVKDHLKVKGLIQTCGRTQNTVCSQYSCEVVQLLQRLGCVAYAHTNVPEGLLGVKSENPVYGCAKNPYDARFTSGGSSGGEGVQVAGRASAFGLGSDSAGSVRIPAAFCGVYGFKPSGSKRLSLKGRVAPSGKETHPMNGVDASLGFITRNVQDLVWLCLHTFGQRMPDSTTRLYAPWDQHRFQTAKHKKIKFGYITSHKGILTFPAVENVIHQTIEVLKKNGHQVQQFHFPDIGRFVQIFCSYIQLIMFKAVTQNPKQNQQLQFIKKNALNQDKDFIQKHALFHEEVFKLKQSFESCWKKANLDVLISPTMPTTAPLVQEKHHCLDQLAFCSFQNVLQMPAVSIPVRLVKAQETKLNQRNTEEGNEGNNKWDFVGVDQQRLTQSFGLPVSIQITAPHFADEECLAAAYQISHLLSPLPPPQL